MLVLLLSCDVAVSLSCRAAVSPARAADYHVLSRPVLARLTGQTGLSESLLVRPAAFLAY